MTTFSFFVEKQTARTYVSDVGASWGTAMATAGFCSVLNCLSPVFFISPAIDAGESQININATDEQITLV
jgi:hypothetical protein